MNRQRNSSLTRSIMAMALLPAFVLTLISGCSSNQKVHVQGNYNNVTIKHPDKGKGVSRKSIINALEGHIMEIDSSGEYRRLSSEIIAMNISKQKYAPEEKKKTLSKVDYLQPETVKDLVIKIKKKWQSCEGGRPKEIVFIIHGGMVPFSTGLEEAFTLHKAISGIKEGNEDNEDLCQRYPIFVNWRSGGPEAYWEQLTKIREGERQAALAAASAPIKVVSDLGRGLFDMPSFAVLEGYRLWETLRDSSNACDKNIENLTCPDNPTFDPFSEISEYSQYLIKTPFRLASAPFIHGMGRPAWENMLRRTRNTIMKEPKLVQGRTEKTYKLVENNGLNEKIYRIVEDETSGFYGKKYEVIESGTSDSNKKRYRIVKGAAASDSKKKTYIFVEKKDASAASEKTYRIIDNGDTSDSKEKSYKLVERDNKSDPEKKMCMLVESDSATETYEIDPGALTQLMNGLFMKYPKSADSSQCSQEIPQCSKEIPISFIAHSMGTIIASDLMGRYSGCLYNKVLFMGAAVSIREFSEKVIPILAEQKDMKFYSESLYPKLEAREMSAKGFVPSGSLLEWIDEMFTPPITKFDRTLGNWTNVRDLYHHFPKALTRQMHFRVFGTKTGMPGKHGEFNDITSCFWQESYLKTYRESGMVKKSWETHYTDCIQKLGEYNLLPSS